MSARGTVNSRSACQLHYWRKHPNLHGWMEPLNREKGSTEGQFNCVTLLLTEVDLGRLEADIRAKALAAGLSVFYTSWW